MSKIKGNTYRPEHFKCQYCGVGLNRVTGKEIYGTSKYPGFYWKCISCSDVYVGCHKGTAIPLGTVANKELRTLRNNLHAKFDILWQEQGMGRKNSYNWLS